MLRGRRRFPIRRFNGNGLNGNGLNGNGLNGNGLNGNGHNRRFQVSFTFGLFPSESYQATAHFQLNKTHNSLTFKTLNLKIQAFEVRRIWLWQKLELQVCFGIHRYRLVSVWPDLAKFRHFGKNLHVFEYIFEDWLVFGNILNLICQFFMVGIGQFFMVVKVKYWKMVLPSGHTGLVI